MSASASPRALALAHARMHGARERKSKATGIRRRRTPPAEALPGGHGPVPRACADGHTSSAPEGAQTALDPDQSTPRSHEPAFEAAVAMSPGAGRVTEVDQGQALAAVPDEILRRAALPSIVRALEPGRVCADLRRATLAWVTATARLWGCSFDAPASLPTHATGEVEVEVTASTPPNAIVVWWELDVGGGATLSSGVDSATHWRQLIIPLVELWRRPLAPGSRATLRWEVSAARAPPAG